VSTYEDLLAEILRGLPRRDGAACYGRARQFELLPRYHPRRDQHAALAIAECEKCPAWQPCTHLLDGLDNPPSDMVQAGRIIASGTSLSRKASSTPGKSLRLELAPLSP
jgi:hypothetical protein